MSRLTSYRSLEGISQSELAERFGVPVQRISEVERGVRAPAFDMAGLGYSPFRLAALPDMTEPLHRHYTRTREAAKKRAEPYNKIVGELPEMRRDTVRLVQQATGENRTTYVLVNNRAEGNAPLTIQALVERLQADPKDGAGRLRD